MPTRGLLLLGTDTGVGKTALAQGLLRLGQRAGVRLVPYKPVETGCSPHPTDAGLLCAAAALPDLAPDDICPYQFPVPAAPSVAARLAGSTILHGRLAERASALSSRGDALLVESAGGVLTPYGPNFTSATLSTLFDIAVLLVSADRLGAINHTALALAEIRRQKLPFAGLVMVRVTPTEGPDLTDNAREISALTGVTPLGILRHCPTGHPDQLADAVRTDIDLQTLFGGKLTAPRSETPI